MGDIFELFKKIKTQETKSGPPEYLIVGLGNPGDKYLYTRHNAGFMALDFVAQRLNVKVNQLKFKSLISPCSFGSHSVIIMKPQTFMNLSGEAVRLACDFYKIPVDKVIVISDDICMEPGQMRIRRSGSDGGHNGLYNIIYQMDSDAFPRIRLGVGKKPHKDYDLAKWVLGKMTENELAGLASCFDCVYDSISLIMDGKTDTAMGKYNGRKPYAKETDEI